MSLLEEITPILDAALERDREKDRRLFGGRSKTPTDEDIAEIDRQHAETRELQRQRAEEHRRYLKEAAEESEHSRRTTKRTPIFAWGVPENKRKRASRRDGDEWALHRDVGLQVVEDRPTRREFDKTMMERFAISERTVRRIREELTVTGLVECVADEWDGRVQRMHLTENGEWARSLRGRHGFLRRRQMLMQVLPISRVPPRWGTGSAWRKNAKAYV